MKGKAVAKNKNKAGTVFALCAMDDGTWSVWRLRENYAGHCKGGITRTWGYVRLNMTEIDARDLYQRRLAGRQK